MAHCVFFEGDLQSGNFSSEMFEEVDTVIHCAARVHVMNKSDDYSELDFHLVNAIGTKELAVKAASAGVKRFIFLSTIKVNGEITDDNAPFKFDDELYPQGAYARSKKLAEAYLKEICEDCSMEYVIIRPPLVYGVGVGANFGALLSLVKINMPLPLGSINNKRSYVSVENLTDLIVECISNSSAANCIFLASDDEDMSTSDLIQLMSSSYGKKIVLIPVPRALMSMIGTVLGRRDAVDRLFDSLQVDISHTKNTLGWRPAITVEKAMSKMVGGAKS